MVLILGAFSLFHLVAGMASLGMAVRLLTAEERALWRSKWNLFVAELTCWLYPVIALVCAVVAWREFAAAHAQSLVLLAAPFLWFIVMGVVFAVVDYLEDGIFGNARLKE